MRKNISFWRKDPAPAATNELDFSLLVCEVLVPGGHGAGEGSRGFKDWP